MKESAVGKDHSSHKLQTILASPIVQFLICIAASLITRASTFGDPAIHIDEDFYFLVGHMMHDGAVVYVDVWDRKPWGLFFIYYLIAGLSDSPVAYQLAASLAAGATAWLIARIASRLTNGRGAVAAGIVYLASLTVLGGIGGQAPVFYNLLIVAAYWLIVRNLPALRAGSIPGQVYGAMLLGGLAITLKQTTVFEALFLGLFTTYALVKAGLSARRLLPTILLFGVLGIGPSALIAVWYGWAGYWPEYYHAMFASNLHRFYESPTVRVLRIVVLVLLILPFLAAAGFAIARHRRDEKVYPWRDFLCGWLVAAFAGFVVVPNFVQHYALPLMVPLAVVAAPLLGRKDFGLLVAASITAYLLYFGDAFNFSRHSTSARNMAALAQAMHDRSPNGTALVYDAPPYLYRMSGLKPLSPLVFPNHLSEMLEWNVSHLNTAAELDRVLAAGPGVVAIPTKPRAMAPYTKGRAEVRAYVATHCRFVAESSTFDMKRNDVIQIFGDCRKPGNSDADMRLNSVANL